MIEADTYSYWVLVGFFCFFVFCFLRILLGWAFGYLFRIDVGFFFWACSVKSKQICSVNHKVLQFFFWAESYTFGFGWPKIFFFFFLDFSSKFVWHKIF